LKKAGFIVFIGVFLLLKLQLNSQSDTSRHSLLKLRAIYISPGASGYEKQASTIKDFRQLAPGNSLVHADTTGFTQRSMDQNYTMSFLVQTAFNPYSKKKQAYNRQIEFTLGLLWQNQPKWKLNAIRTDKIRSDTLSSNSTGAVFYIDSTATRRYFYTYRGVNLGLDLSNTFHTRQTRLFSFYTGYNATLIYSFNNRVIAEYASPNSGRIRHTFFAPVFYESREITALQNNVLFCGSVPIGVNMRVLKPRRKKATIVSFNFEFRPGLKYEQIGHLAIGWKAWYMYSFGIKLYLSAEDYN
jgi:hypothetical protein